MGIEVLPAVGRWDGFASFMVPRKLGGGGCVCMAYRNSSLGMPERIAHMRGLCESEPGPGVLAFVDGEAAGWCSIAPKSTYRALVNSRTIPHVQDEGAWSVVCFVVRPGFRRRGLMHQPLDGAVGHAHAMGAVVLEGYPVDPGGERIDQTSGYVGTVQLFEAHGFRRVRQTAGRARRPAPLARPPRASLTSPALCSPADPPPPGSTKGTAVVTAPSATSMNDLLPPSRNAAPASECAPIRSDRMHGPTVHYAR